MLRAGGAVRVRRVGGESSHRGEGHMHIEQLAIRIRGEFAEMPGLRLSLHQAARLWGLDPATCRAVVGLLLAQSILRVTNGHISARE